MMNIARLGTNVALGMARHVVARSALVRTPAIMSSAFIREPASCRLYHGITAGSGADDNQSKTRGMAGVATQASLTDRELSEYLAGEIQAEKQLVKMPKHGPGVPGFDVTANGSSIKLTRKLNDEVITVKFNVNGTVDSLDEPEFEGPPSQQPPPPQAEMKARPDFLVEVQKPSGRMLVFTCRMYGDEDDFGQAQPEDEQKGDKFEIESFSVLNKDDIDEFGEWDDNVYMADGSIADGQMYDLLMNYLDERGISAEFADHVIEYATHYEHNQYVQLLEKMRTFIEGK